MVRSNPTQSSVFERKAMSAMPSICPTSQLSVFGGKAAIVIVLRDTCRLSINIQHSIVEVISRDRFDQLPREGCLGFSTRGGAILQ